MPTGFQLRVDQISIHADFKGSAIRFDQLDIRDEFGVLLFKRTLQTESSRSVVSRDAVFNRDFVGHDLAPVCDCQLVYHKVTNPPGRLLCRSPAVLQSN